jgi:hypothetical protein
MSQDAEGVAEELGDPCSGLQPSHLNARQCVSDVCGVDAAHHQKNGEPLFEVEYVD